MKALGDRINVTGRGDRGDRRSRSLKLHPGLHIGVTGESSILSDTGLSPLCAYVSQFLLR